MFLRLIVNLMVLKNSGIPPLAVIPTVLILLLAFVLSVGGYRASASGNMTSGNMTSESPSTPTTTTNSEKTPPRSCDEWWSPSMGVLPDCPTQGNTSKGYSEGFRETKTADGTSIRTTEIPSMNRTRVDIRTPDGTVTMKTNVRGETIDTSILLRNPAGVDKTLIGDTQGDKNAIYQVGSLSTVNELERKPYGYSAKQADGTVINFYRDPNPDSPSHDNWVTETKTTDGKVITVYRNNDRSFVIATKNPDGSNSTAVEKPDGTTITKDSRGITRTTNSDGTWYLTYPKSEIGRASCRERV